MQALILRLQGPMMSFGDVAIDDLRPTRRLPGRAMLTGLIANALGYEHREVDRLQRLQDRIRFAARLDAEGELLRDYQTAEIARNDRMWTTRGKPAERAGGAKSYLGPVLRDRHYRADSAVTLALTLLPEDETPSLDAIEKALHRPARPLFIGRKGCPPAGPILDRQVKATSLVAALKEVPLTFPERQRSSASLVETEEGMGEADGGRAFDLADLRDWRFGLHTGNSRRLELKVRTREGEA